MSTYKIRNLHILAALSDGEEFDELKRLEKWEPIHNDVEGLKKAYKAQKG